MTTISQVKELEEIVIDYVERYGATELAHSYFRKGPDQKTVSVADEQTTSDATSSG